VITDRTRTDEKLKRILVRSTGAPLAFEQYCSFQSAAVGIAVGSVHSPESVQLQLVALARFVYGNPDDPADLIAEPDDIVFLIENDFKFAFGHFPSPYPLLRAPAFIISNTTRW
jgi:hypothetical protein